MFVCLYYDSILLNQVSIVDTNIWERNTRSAVFSCHRQFMWYVCIHWVILLYIIDLFIYVDTYLSVIFTYHLFSLWIYIICVFTFGYICSYYYYIKSSTSNHENKSWRINEDLINTISFSSQLLKMVWIFCWLSE